MLTVANEKMSQKVRQLLDAIAALSKEYRLSPVRYIGATDLTNSSVFQ